MADETGADAQVPAPGLDTPADAGAPAPTSETPKGATSAREVAAPDPKPDAEAGGQEPPEPANDKPAENADDEMKAAVEAAPDAPAAGEEPAAAPTETAAAAAANRPAVATPVAHKSKAPRKSSGAESKGKKLNRKSSKPRLVHLDAKPGDHFFVKLKGYPPWPAIICDEDMLPISLLKSRPVSAARPDGTYREDYADGGKRAADRTFAVMYLSTNEFGWVPNTDLRDLDASTVLESVNEKMRKDLQNAHELASKMNPLGHYKEVLRQFQEEMTERTKAKELADSAKSAKISEPPGAPEKDEDGDVDMADQDQPKTEKKPKKRKAEEEEPTPQRSDSVKKPKFKVISSSTPKGANGSPAAKPPMSAESKQPKPKSKKAAKVEKEQPKEAEYTPQEKHQRKEKEVLFLRHKLQKGLLTRDQEPKPDEMKLMSDYVAKLEGFPDLEVSIIRATKINKVLKAILKLASIPKEDEFRFKTRSQDLLDKWNKLLAVDGPPAAVNGVNGKSSDEAGHKAEDTTGDEVNGATQNSKPKAEAPEAETAETTKPAEPPVQKEEEGSEDGKPAKAPEAVESTA